MVAGKRTGLALVIAHYNYSVVVGSPEGLRALP